MPAYITRRLARLCLRTRLVSRKKLMLAAIAAVLAMVVVDVTWRAVDIYRSAEGAQSGLRVARDVATSILEGDPGMDIGADLDFLQHEIREAERDARHARSRLGYLGFFLPLAGWFPGDGGGIAHAPEMLDLLADVAIGSGAVLDAFAPVLSGDGPPLLRLRESIVINGDVLDSGITRLRNASAQAALLGDFEWRGPFAGARPLLTALETLGLKFEAADVVLENRAVLDKALGFEGPQTILVLGQNEHEIRPTGGFIGTLGLITMVDGEIQSMEFGDSATFAPGEPKVPPSRFSDFYGASEWYVRDANWWPHFPTSAAAAIDFVERDRGVRVDSVLAINTTMLDLLIRRFQPVVIAGNIEAPTTLRADQQWVEGATIGVTEDERIFIRAVPGIGRHALAYSRRDIVSAGDLVTLEVEVRAGGHRWVAFGEASDTEWHAAFFDVEAVEVVGTWGVIEDARIRTADRPGWYRLEVVYRPHVTTDVTAWIEVAGGSSATAGFNATGDEIVEFDQLSIEVGAGAGEGARVTLECTFVPEARAYLAGLVDECPTELAFQGALTEDNWLASLERNLLEEGGQSGKANFLVPLVEELARRLTSASAPELVGLVGAFRTGAEGRNFQWFHTNSGVQSVLEKIGVDGSMGPSRPGEDFLAVVDTNLSQSKIQPALTRDVTYLRGVDSSVTIVARWANHLSSIPLERYQRLAGPGVLYDRAHQTYTESIGPYGAYVRFYVPEGSRLVEAVGFDGPPGLEAEGGFLVFSGYISVLDGETQEVVLKYRPPEGSTDGVRVWKQGGTIQGEWRILQNVPPGEQLTLYRGPLVRDLWVEFPRRATSQQAFE